MKNYKATITIVVDYEVVVTAEDAEDAWDLADELTIEDILSGDCCEGSEEFQYVSNVEEIKMAKLHCSDGRVINISKETEVELRKAFEPKVKHGDILEDDYCRIVIIDSGEGMKSCYGSPNVWNMENELLIKNCNYKIVGNVFER